MDNFGAGTELETVLVTRSSKRAPTAKNDVRVMHRHIGLVEAMHTQHAEELRSLTGISAQAHEGIGHGVIQSPRERVSCSEPSP
jgi:hypothetical protein